MSRLLHFIFSFLGAYTIPFVFIKSLTYSMRNEGKLLLVWYDKEHYLCDGKLI